MKASWMNELFGTYKPIIAMCHFKPLPGDPSYDQKHVIDSARKDLIALHEGGVDAVMFSNEFSLPYLLKVEPITLAAMARVITALMDDIHVPYGVNVLWDPTASIDLAVTVGASFVREIFSGVYASDFGLWNTNFGEVVRHQHRVGGQNVRLLFKVEVKLK